MLDGTVEPLRPGERVIHGRQPGAHDSFDVTGGAQVRAAEARSRRERASEHVVEMDYRDFRAEDADEPFDIDGGVDDPATDALLDSAALIEAAVDDESLLYAERLITDDSALELRIAGVEAAILQLGTDQDERFDALGGAFLALAKGISEELVAIRKAVEGCEPTTASEPESGIEKKWWHFLYTPGLVRHE